MHLTAELYYSYGVRIEINPSALAHGITPNEIRAVINNYELRFSIPTRLANVDANNYLYIGRPADNEPWIELIADHADADVRVIFHAMMLRPSTIAALDHVGTALTPQYSRQRR